jgi:hypothetical protein
MEKGERLLFGWKSAQVSGEKGISLSRNPKEDRIQQFCRFGHLECERPLIFADAKEVAAAPGEDELRGSRILLAKPFAVNAPMRIAFERFRWQKVTCWQV